MDVSRSLKTCYLITYRCLPFTQLVGKRVHCANTGIGQKIFFLCLQLHFGCRKAQYIILLNIFPCLNVCKGNSARDSLMRKRTSAILDSGQMICNGAQTGPIFFPVILIDVHHKLEGLRKNSLKPVAVPMRGGQ